LTKDKIESVLKYFFQRATTKNDKNQKPSSGNYYFQLILSFESILKDINIDTQISNLLPDIIVDPTEYLSFIESAQELYRNYKVNCNNTLLNDYLIEHFKSNDILKFDKQLILINKYEDISAFKDFIQSSIKTLKSSLPDFQLKLTSIIDVGKILSKDGKSIFIIPEQIAIDLIKAVPQHDRVIDLLLSIITSNLINQNPAHLEPCKTILGESKHLQTITNEYKYYINYGELIKYELTFPSILIKAAIKELTNSDNETGTDAFYFLSKYNDIKSNIFGNDPLSLNKFIIKLDSFSRVNDIVVNATNLLFIIPILKDNHSVNCNIITEIINLSNSYIKSIDQSTWDDSFVDFDNSNTIELVLTMITINKYCDAYLPSISNSSYINTITNFYTTKKVPSDYSNWNIILDHLSGNFTTLFKNVRDSLFHPEHGDVKLSEFVFYEKGLFKFGFLNENQLIADNTLRKIIIPLMSTDDIYLNILRQNAVSIKDIIIMAKESNIDFKEAIDKKCPQVYQDKAMNIFTDILNEYYNKWHTS